MLCYAHQISDADNLHGAWVRRAPPRRFEVYPYLEQFAMDVARELRKELGGRPDFIIGNYSDGNLVASLLSRRAPLCVWASASGQAHGRCESHLGYEQGVQSHQGVDPGGVLKLLERLRLFKRWRAARAATST